MKGAAHLKADWNLNVIILASQTSGLKFLMQEMALW